MIVECTGFFRDNFYKYCWKVLASSEIQKSILFPISRKIPFNPSIFEHVIHSRTICFRITRLLLHLCNNRSLLSKVVQIINWLFFDLFEFFELWNINETGIQYTKQKAWYATKLFLSRLTDEETYWKNHFWARWSPCSLCERNSSATEWTRSMIDELRETGPFHVLHGRLIYCFWIIFCGEYIRTNINKTRINDLNELKIRIIEGIQLIEKRTLQVVFLEIGKGLVFYISVEDNTIE